MDGQCIDILKQPGKLTLEDVKEYAKTIWSDPDPEDDMVYQKQIRHNMMGQFLIDSITSVLRKHIHAKRDQWFYEEQNAIDGLVLFKILISYGAIGSRAGINKNKR